MAGLLEFLGRNARLEREQKQHNLDVARRTLADVDRLSGVLSDRATVPTDRLLDVEGGPAMLIPSATPGGRVGLLSTPAGEREMAGLLARIAPQETAGAIAGQMFPPARENELLEALAAAGIDAASPRGQKIIESHFRGGSDIQDQLAALQLTQAIDEWQRGLVERADEADVKRRNIMNRGLTIQGLAEQTQRLAGTFMEPGFPWRELVREGVNIYAAISEAFGGDPSKERQMITDYDLMKKGFQELVNDAIARGGLTNDQLKALETASANENISPDAILKILQMLSRIHLSDAEIGVGGIPVNLGETGDWLREFARTGVVDTGTGNGREERTFGTPLPSENAVPVDPR